MEKSIDTSVPLTPYEEGAAAYLKGVPFHQNPHDPVEAALAYDQWENGYWMASVKDAPADDETTA